MADLPLWAVVLGLFAALARAGEPGFLANRRWVDPAKPAGGDAGYVLSAALGLLALLLAFTFSVALTRHDERRAMVVQEANAIGTAWLRAGLVGNDEGAQLQAALGDYAETRLTMVRAGGDPAATAQADADGAALLKRIWGLTDTATLAIRTTPQAASLIEAVNAVIDLNTSRKAALAAHVPQQVLALLIGYAIAAALILGYVLGIDAERHRPITLGLFALLALTVGLILDLDRPWSGAIRTSQQPMIDLVATIKPPA